MGYAQGQNTVSTANIIDSAVTTAKVNDDAITLAKMAPGTDGNLITYDASGDPAAVATGTSGQVLTSGGAGVAPTFAAVSGGKVLQVVTAVYSTRVDTTSTSVVTTGLTASITPSSTSNKILVLTSSPMGTYYDNGSAISARYGGVFLFRGTVAGTELTRKQFGRTLVATSTVSGSSLAVVPFVYLDSPSTDSAVSYTVGMASVGTGLNTVAQQNATSMKAEMVLLEIEG
jgi:hypothetical protein